MKEFTKLVFGPLTSILMGMILLAICVLMGHKVTTDRGWGKKSGEGSSRGKSTEKRKKGQTVGENSQSEFDI